MGVDFELIHRTKIDVSLHVGQCPRCKYYVNLESTERLEGIKHISGRFSHKVCNICQVLIRQEIQQELACMKEKNEN